MTSPFTSAGDSTSSGYVLAGTTLASSSPSQPECDLCARIWQTGHEWPPKENLQKPCHGYPALANLMSHNPGFESFQAFRDLHIKSLLYYQGQLDNIRAELHTIEWQDHNVRTFKDHENLSKNVGFLFKPETDLATGGAQSAFSEPSAGGEGVGGAEEGKSDQLRKVEEMRKVLKDYSEALLLYTKINVLPQPETFRVKNLLQWLRIDRPIEGGGSNSWGPLLKLQPERPSILSQFCRLVRTIFWSKEEDDIHLDLVVPLKNKSADGLTKWIESEAVPFWERILAALQKRREGILPRTRASRPSNRNSTASGTTLTKILSGLFRKLSNDSQASEKVGRNPGGEKIEIVTYRFRVLLAVATFITTLSASLFLPVVAIVVLSKLHAQSMILGFIALFTGLFTIGNMILTPAGTKRTEIFNASAAFAAVMVVFVHNQTGGNGS